MITSMRVAPAITGVINANESFQASYGLYENVAQAQRGQKRAL